MKNLLVILFLLFMKLNLFGQVPNFGDFPKNILEHLNKMGTESSHFLNGEKWMKAYGNFNTFMKLKP